MQKWTLSSSKNKKNMCNPKSILRTVRVWVCQIDGGKVKQSGIHPDFWTVSHNYRGKWCVFLYFTPHTLIRRSRVREKRARHPCLPLLSHSIWLLPLGTLVWMCAVILMCAFLWVRHYMGVWVKAGECKANEVHTHTDTHTCIRIEIAILLLEDIMSRQNTNINLIESHWML